MQAGRKPFAHSDYVRGPINLHGYEDKVDVMIEAKMKARRGGWCQSGWWPQSCSVRNSSSLLTWSLLLFLPHCRNSL
jgi:hypothetical protein